MVQGCFQALLNTALSGSFYRSLVRANGFGYLCVFAAVINCDSSAISNIWARLHGMQQKLRKSILLLAQAQCSLHAQRLFRTVIKLDLHHKYCTFRKIS